MRELEEEMDISGAQYYVECATLPMDIQKKYYAHGSTIAVHHLEEQLQVISSIQEYCEILASYVQELFQGISSSDNECLFNVAAQMALDMKKVKLDIGQVMKLVNAVKEKTNEVENFLVTKTGKKLFIDKEKMEQIYALLLEDSGDAEVQEDEVSAETAVRYAGVDTETIEKELNGSLSKLLTYSQLPEEKCAEFQQSVLAFMNMKDKTSTEDDARKIRRTLTNGYYELYEAVFLLDYKEKSKDRIIDLFLLYGFVDERLLSKEQLIELYCLEDQNNEQGPCKVYNSKQWLSAVLEGKKEPSKSCWNPVRCQCWRWH